MLPDKKEVMSNSNTLVNQRDKLVKDLEDALSKRDLLKKILADPAELDKFLLVRVAHNKEAIAKLDLNDRSFMLSYCDKQARIFELEQLRAELRSPENNCKELQTRISEIDSLIDERSKLVNREKY